MEGFYVIHRTSDTSVSCPREDSRKIVLVKLHKDPQYLLLTFTVAGSVRHCGLIAGVAPGNVCPEIKDAHSFPDLPIRTSFGNTESLKLITMDSAFT